MQNSKAPAVLPLFAIFLGLFLAAAPLAADEIDELKQQIEILARRIEQLERERELVNAAGQEKTDPAVIVTAGEVPGSWRIPGTDTSMSIGGFIEATYIYDIGPRPPSRGGDIASARSAILEDDPRYENRGDARITARNSRFNISTWTSTRFGRLRTFLEGDFNGPPNDKGSRATTSRTAFGIRHAYGELGNWLFGHYWTTFSDNSVFPNKVDGTGPAGRTFMRQGQLRYTRELVPGGELAVALENPHGDFAGADDDTLEDSYPDLTAHYRYERDDWHLQFSGMLRRMGWNDAVTGTDISDHATGWGLNQSGAFLLPGTRDRVSWYVIFGDGIGRYLEGGADQGATVTAADRLDTQFGYGGFLTYRHRWTDTLESNLDFGYTAYDLNPEEVGDANRRLYSSHVNLLWMPQDNIEFGIEYVWGHREVLDGREGFISRINAHSIFYF